jgi:hypothetical protein
MVGNGDERLRLRPVVQQLEEALPVMKLAMGQH